MAHSHQAKIVYLLGAGATRAELSSIEEFSDDKEGLRLREISSRIIDRARKKPSYLRGLEMVSSPKGSLNIELLISLIESSKIENWDSKSRLLKQFVKDDLNKILTSERKRKFYLHKSLFELHNHSKTQSEEKLLGIISLNYDDVADQAYRKFYGVPNYCFSLDKGTDLDKKIPLLKLHGSFNWNEIRIRGIRKTIEIIPLGANKNYLYPPYNFIWSKAMEILIECDVLRVIGCSLSSNDVHLIDLIFKAHLEKGRAFFIEIISSEDTGNNIKKTYGFFPEIKTLTEIGSPHAGYKNGSLLIPNGKIDNAFETWLKYKTNSILKKPTQRKRTQYLKKLFD